ncbi:MAG TPA: hypothetical protein VLI93_09615 [Acetobacteraceae bacterium]|nr:hypothetical protein [Acetobacteraceae bacterium]
MRTLLFAAAAALALSSGAAFAAGNGGNSGGGNGGATPPHVSTTNVEGSKNAVPPSYGVSPSTPTAAAPSSDRYAGQGPQTKTLNGQNTTGSTATLPGPSTATR